MNTSVQDAYEALYTGKSYQHEMGLVDVVLDRHLPPAGPGKKKPARRVLEIGCGPGLRLAVLRQMHGKYEPEGLDHDPAMLTLARRRVRGLPLHQGDMRSFNLETRYDSILCLFGVIGYLKNLDDLTITMRTIREHLVPRGVFLLEPWLSPDAVIDGYLHADSASRNGLKVTRMTYTRVVGNKSRIDVHYLIGDPSGICHVETCREMTLFTDEEYRTGLRDAGFGDVVLDAYGPQGRGLYTAQV